MNKFDMAYKTIENAYIKTRGDIRAAIELLAGMRITQSTDFVDALSEFVADYGIEDKEL